MMLRDRTSYSGLVFFILSVPNSDGIALKHMLCWSSSVGTAEPGHPLWAGTWFQSWQEWGL